MDTGTLDIQQLVNESGVTRRTIYFYVQQGLLPPPQGAGLAAYYTEEHLLRLKAIPALRQQGLRLDQIRERLAAMNNEEMRGLIGTYRQKLVLDEPKEKYKADQVVGLPFMAALPLRAADWREERFIHYAFPGGMLIVVPETIQPADRVKLNQLLEAAKKIYSIDSPQYVAHETKNDGSDI